jgi:HTH-type transcriptional regulator / antitoxin HigA
MSQAIVNSWKGFTKQLKSSLPPRSEQDYIRLVKLADSVADALSEDASLESLLDFLSEHIAHWESQNQPPIKPPSPAAMLQFYMDQQSLSQQDLAREGFINQGNLSKILSGERPIGLRLAGRLAKRFSTDVTVFV